MRNLLICCGLFALISCTGEGKAPTTPKEAEKASSSPQTVSSETSKNEVILGENEKIVMAHFMHQMSVGAECKPREGTLNFTPSLPNDTMATHVQEYLENYRKPLDAAKQDIRKAQESGVNVLAMLLGSNHLPGSQFASVIHAYWQVASETKGFKMSTDLWADWRENNETQIEGIKKGFEILKSKYDGTWLRYKGRYVVSINTNPARKPATGCVKASDLENLFAPLGGRKNVFLIFYSPVALKEAMPDLFNEADGFVDWNCMPYSVSRKDVDASMALAKESGKEFWGQVIPSFTQSRSSLTTPNVREKLGMVGYLSDWKRAIEGNLPAVYLITWNDLTEDSAVMPDSNHSYAFFELNKYYAQWFKKGKPPEISKEQVFLFHHPQVVENLLVPEGRKPMSAFPWAMKTPPTDYVGVVVLLKKPAKVAIQLGEQVIAEKEFPAGASSWLVYHPSPLSTPDSYPIESDGIATTIYDKPFHDAMLYMAVYRDNQRIGLFRSHQPIRGAAGRGEMVTIGNVFDLK